MATPIILSTGTSSGAGTAGEGRDDLVSGETVNLEDTEPLNSGATYSWSFVDRPVGSVATMINPTTATPSFVVDAVGLEGSYKIRCLVNGVDQSEEILAVSLPNLGSRIPAFSEETEYDEAGNAKGWHPAVTDFMRATDTAVAGTGPHVATHQDGGADELNVAGLSGELADPQPPKTHATDHQPGGGDAMAVDQAAATGSLRTLGTGAQQACAGNDSRLSDARTPTSHASTHQPGGGDAMAVDAAAATGSLRTIGTGAQQACAGNDSRLSDARTPTSHATSHQAGGGDAIKLDDLAAPDDNTDLDATISAHGLLKKLGGGTTNFLRADGAWAAPPGGTDADAIHDNVAAEISAVTEKATPISADLLLIEDSADSNNKKRVQIGNLPGGGTGFATADYIVANRITTDQADPVASDPVEFNYEVGSKSGGDLALDTTTNVGRFSGLKAGRTYVLLSGIKSRNGGVPNSYITAQWYNVTAAAAFGSSPRSTRFLANDSLNNQSDAGPAMVIFTPSVDTEVEMRHLIVSPAGTDLAIDSFAAIWELAGPQFGASTETLINTIRAGDVASHDSATPLVVSQFAFDPSEYSLTGAARSLKFRAVAANGGGIAQTKARVYNVTDAEYVGAGLTFTSATPTKQEETLTIGTGTGEVDDAEKVYEVRIWCVSPDAVDDTIELGSAELRLINTIS